MNDNRKCIILTVIIFLIIGISQPLLAQSNSTETETQKGAASWYGSRFHGKKTSSGEPYNKYEMTAAHKTLPFGTKVKVTNLDNNETVVVRINDRGPFVGDRIIDVSEAAARELEFRKKGIGHVKIEVLGSPTEIASAIGFDFDVTDLANNTFSADAADGLADSRN